MKKLSSKILLLLLFLTTCHLSAFSLDSDRYEKVYILTLTTFHEKLHPDSLIPKRCNFGGAVNMCYEIDKVTKTATFHLGTERDVKEFGTSGTTTIVNSIPSDGYVIFDQVDIPGEFIYKNEIYKVTTIGKPFIKYERLYTITFTDFKSGKSDLYNHYTTTIGEGAFAGTNISKVDFGYCKNLKTIERNAFAGCKDLISVEGIHGDLDYIGQGAFEGCTSLKFLGENWGTITEIKKGAFYNCKSMTRFPFSITNAVGENAFSGCSSLENLQLDEVISIGERAFEGCESLTIEINGPYTFKSDFWATGVDYKEYAFSGFNGKDINFNGTMIVTMGPKIFYECYADNVIFNEGCRVGAIGDSAFAYSTCNVDFSKILDIGSLEYYLGKYCFMGASGKVTFPQKVGYGGGNYNVVKNMAFYNYCYPDFEFSFDINSWQEYQSLCFANSTIKKFKINPTNDLTYVTIDPRAFSNCKYLEHFEITGGSSISLNKITLPEGLLADTPSLKMFYVPKLSVVPKHLFARSGIEKIDFTQTAVSSIEDEAFIGSKIKNFDRSRSYDNKFSVMSFGKDVFKDCNELDSINLSFAGISQEITDPTLFHFRHINLLGNKMDKITLYDGFEHLILPRNQYYDEDIKRWEYASTANYDLALPEDQIRTKAVVIEGGTPEGGIPTLIADEKSIENWNKNKLPAFLFVDDEHLEEYQQDPVYTACFTILPLSKGPGVFYLSEEEKTLRMGEYFTLTATFFNDPGIFEIPIYWTIDNPEIASIEVVPGEKNSLLVKGLKTGETFVTCSVGGLKPQSMTCKIIVNTLLVDDIPVLKLEFDEEENVLVACEMPYQLKLKVFPEDHTETLKWETSFFHEELYTGVEVDQNGVVIGHGSLGADITVSSEFCSATLHVQPKSSVQEFFCDADTITMMRNDIATIKAIRTIPEAFYDSAEFNCYKSWQGNGDVEILDTAPDKKSFTIKGTKVGYKTVTVTCTNGWQSKYIIVNVTEENVRSFELSENKKDVWLNESGTLEIISINPDDFKNPRFEWSVNDDENIEITQVSADTKSISFTAKESGDYLITARSLDNNTVYATCRINALEKTVKQFELSDISILLYTDDVAELSVLNITPDIFEDSEFEWTTDNSNAVITNISSNTQTITLEGKEEGETVITATSLVNPAITATCTVYVRHPFVEPPRLEGDANGDGEINVTDVVMGIKYILSPEEDAEFPSYLDLNNDGEINVTDITMLIKMILEPQSTRSTFNGVGNKYELSGRLQYNNVDMISDQHLELPVSLYSYNDLAGLQADIITDGNVVVEDIVSCDKHTIEWRRIDNNRVRMIMYDINNETLTQAAPIFTLKVRNLSDLNGNIYLTDIIGADSLAHGYSLDPDNISLDTASIGFGSKKSVSIDVNGNTLYVYNAEGKEVNVYNLNGIAVRSFISPSDFEEIKLEPGIYVVKVNDYINKILIR